LQTSEETESSEEDESGSCISIGDESRSSNGKIYKKKVKKHPQKPSKLARVRLEFDVLERERMENKRRDIQVR